MQVVIPNKLKILDGSSVAENDAPEWATSTIYKTDDRVIRNHYVYQARAEHTGKDPEKYCETADDPWRLLYPTNKYACIDIYNYTQTVAQEGATTVTIKVPYSLPATAIGLLHMKAVRVSVSVDTHEGENFFSESYDLLKDSISAWDYWFGPFRFQKDLILTKLPPSDGVVTIELEHSDRPAIGLIIVGQWVQFGMTEYGARSGFIDFSQHTTNTYGDVTWVQRRNARRATYPVFLHPSDSDYVHDVLSDLAGNPALWVGDNGAGFSSLSIWGFLKEFDDAFEDYGKNSANFEVEGII